MKLHIGCGKRNLGPGWTHVDVEKHAHVDIICDIRDLDSHFAADSVDEIYACHVLEHVGRHAFPTVLESFSRILKPGGIVRIAVPDCGKAMQLYASDPIKYPLYPTLYGQFWGGQKNAYDGHLCGFDFTMMQEQLMRVDFRDVARYEWRDFLPPNYDDYSRSYLPHMDFENGVCLSLNVVATKTTKKNRPVREVAVFCTGGLCNALDSLIGGHDIAKRILSEPARLIVYWIEGYIANDIEPKDLFDFDFDCDDCASEIRIVTLSEFKQWVADHPDAITLSHSAIPELIQKSPPPLNPNNLKDAKQVKDILEDSSNRHRDVIFQIDVLPPWIALSCDVNTVCASFFNNFKIKHEHLNAARSMIKNNNVSVGVHVRGTDLFSISGKTLADVRQFIAGIVNSKGLDKARLFACSDDENVERIIKEFEDADHKPRFCMFDKTYVTMRDTKKSWYAEDQVNPDTQMTIEHGGKEYKQYASTNVVRTHAQIIGAWIDLLALAHCEHLIGFVTSKNSTYFGMGNFLKRYFKGSQRARSPQSV